ncbi:DUF4136 domain-containing protein [Phenylobacterium sp.]|uniref:DUF4136 domain-containing protein n=1 Tax=Phenylobacterium sp. TaxID=1871053 RepID=UPI00289C608B|nr:DUF4136 domain-containing protein [Phenylobacterium sp.]
MPSGVLKSLALSASLTLASLALAACESPGGKVSVLSGDSVQVAPGSTWAWAPGAQPGSGDPRIDNDIIQGRIKSAVEGALAAKGYRLVDASSANLLVQYHIGLQNKTETRVDTFGGPRPAVACGIRGCIGGYGWGMYGAPMDVDVRNIDYVEGTVMLDMIDRASGKLAWRATSQKRLDEKDADQAGVNAIVTDMVKSLP